MTGVLVGLLAILWGAVLLPVLMSARQNTSVSGSVGTFSRSMRALGSNHIQPSIGGGRWVLTPRSVEDDGDRRMRMLRRRRIFVALLGTLAGSLVLGMLPPFRMVLWASPVLALVLGGYVAFLIQEKNRRPVTPRRPAEPRRERSPIDDVPTVLRLANTPPAPMRVGGRTVHRIVDESFDDDGLGELGFLKAGRY